MKVFVFFLMLVGLVTISYSISDVSAICMANQDWPDAPCYGCRGCSPTIEEQKQDWAPYYDYKGKEFMEQKKQEMLNAIKDDRLSEWLNSGPEDQHHNIYQYYELHGLETKLLFSGMANYVVLIILAVGSAAGIGIFVLRKL